MFSSLADVDFADDVACLITYATRHAINGEQNQGIRPEDGTQYHKK